MRYIYLLEIEEGNEDCIQAQVIIANGVQEAYSLANDACGDEGPVWKEADITKLGESRRPKEIVLISWS